MAGIWRDEMLHERFADLTQLLKAGELFWRHHAFQMLRLPWEAEFPQMARTLRALSLDTAERLARSDQALLGFLSEHLPWCSVILDCCEIGEFAATPLPDIEPRDIPGRKWQQIRHFVPHIPANDLAVLEWCSGKAHMGRTLVQQRGCAVSALEYDARLIEEGEALAAREQVAIDFHCVDAMGPSASTLIREKQNVVALHACGDLHAQMLRLAARAHTATVTLAPCCYHLVGEHSRSVISAAAKASGLQLSRDDLRTAVHGTMTAAARQVCRRQQLQAWRLGFDLLQRDVRGGDEYLPTPSLPLSELDKG
ncbi:MAG TPA: methyltransferase, partial [Spongiibacteraceae bacterium]|nr:methyltransferase [Spongiibacteraceae bacterium]